jgi:type I restriction enzyme M protein
VARSTVHYADNTTNNILKRLHNKLRPAGTPVQRVEYIIELLLLRIFEVKLKQDSEFAKLRGMFSGDYEDLLFSDLISVPNEQILSTLNSRFFPFYADVLNKARAVHKGNLSVKVQDQLVLIHEVFSNSNFTNNVQTGNLKEVLGLIGDLDEDRLLKTDLLGDAIESALSETGGTKDIGLHRTPDHIRQLMVALVRPTFDDYIFDPTAGTGGFLFDSFEYIMQGVTKDGNWPGAKSHPDLAAWFKRVFKKHKSAMPSKEKATDFYRTGAMGIEYLGMIRKMASINFYIRGLNPGNIMQGDALAMFKKEFLPESKSVILANPPFGAERDQDAYPDVWSEYPKESETTILFVKLMLETLKKGGRCAVIVSEGFMTWDQNSARALRRSLLDEANLRAIISLPQGVFVSKGGQGPKTSILYFEKGVPTRDVWFYKVTNDGYTMGTNRKPIPGCQFVEALDLFDQFVRRGKQPPETKHSFTIPAEWIKTLDPRVKERIRSETREELTAKAVEDKKKLSETLAKKVEAKKLKQQEMDERLNQHDQLWENKIRNEIARKIERAHLYSFNLPNYRSKLTQEQIQAWKDFTAPRIKEPSANLDEQYRKLKNAKPADLDAMLSALNPRNTLELDIARQFLDGIDDATLESHPHLKTLDEIIASQSRHPRKKLSGLIEPKYDRVKKDEYDGVLPIVEKISFADGVAHFREDRETGMDLYRASKGDLVTSKINIHQGAVVIAPCDLVASTHYQIYQVQVGDVKPEYLAIILRSPQFLTLLNEQKSKGIKNEQGAEFLSEFEIPLPESQESLVSEFHRQQTIIDASTRLLQSIRVNFDVNASDLQAIGRAVVETKNGWSPRCDGGRTPVLTLSCLKRGRIDLTEVKYTDLTRDDIDRFYVQEGDFFYSRGNTQELVALAGVAKGVTTKVVFSDLLTRVVFDETLILPEFVVLLFNSELGRSYFGNTPMGASPTMVKVSQDYMEAFKVPYLGDIAKQNELIQASNKHMELIASLEQTRCSAERKLAKITEDIWQN